MLNTVTLQESFLETALAAARAAGASFHVGNIFSADLFYTPGRFLGAIDPAFALVAMLGLLLTNLALIGNMARVERRLAFVEADALLIMLVYFGGMVFLFVRGIG